VNAESRPCNTRPAAWPASLIPTTSILSLIGISVVLGGFGLIAFL
jgi:hypothetical protein